MVRILFSMTLIVAGLVACKTADQSTLSISGGDVAIAEKPLLKMYSVQSQKRLMDVCTASPIGPSVGLTAAHCVDKTDEQTGLVVLDNKRVLAIRKAVILKAYYSVLPHGHPTVLTIGEDKPRNSFFDVALLYFDEHSFEHWFDVADAKVLDVGTPVQFYGFGCNYLVKNSIFSTNGEAPKQIDLSSSPLLRKVYDWKLILWKSRDNVLQKLSSPYQSDDGALYQVGLKSAENAKLPSVACMGDSGGPLIVDDKIYGVASLGHGRPEVSVVSSYTSLQHKLVKKFIDSRNDLAPLKNDVEETKIDSGSYEQAEWFKSAVAELAEKVDFIFDNRNQINDEIKELYEVQRGP